MHRLLAYQLAKATNAEGELDVPALLAMVDAAYTESDTWRRRTDRATLLMCQEMDELNARLTHLAHYDALTGLPNRNLMDDRLEQALILAHRLGNRVAVLWLDLDHFKEVNDTLGHAAGDELLRIVSGRLRHCLRESDTIARLGGDEFAVIQNGAHQPADAAVLAQRLVDVTQQAVELDGIAVRVGVSIGIALSTLGQQVSAQEMMKQADIALYRAKAAGRHRFSFFDALPMADQEVPRHAGNLR